ncbi:MAG: TonB-dependent receptor [Bacteroidales bacterium]|nr:TonB-dependent receptor [Bacteroidales bacterium]
MSAWDTVKKYPEWFPSVHLAYELSAKHTLQLSYSRRISRPRFRHLLPFYSYSDNKNIIGGNPNL